MTIFGAIGIASTGLTVHRKWLDAVSDNLANVSTVRSTSEEAFKQKYVIAAETAGENQGVHVAGTLEAAARAASSTSPTTRSPTSRGGTCGTPTSTCRAR